jgi:hypothetical protein
VIDLADLADCVDCTDDSEHCHAVWIRHGDGHQECLAVECRIGAAAHLFVIACVDVDPGCCA